VWCEEGDEEGEVIERIRMKFRITIRIKSMENLLVFEKFDCNLLYCILLLLIL
jgi:hypothetical protein